MIGTNADEGTLLAPLVGSPFFGTPAPGNAEEYEQLVREVYPESADEVLALYPAKTDEDLAGAISDLFGDNVFGMQAWFAANAAAASGAPVYLYFFTSESPAPEQWAGAYHAKEIQYVFGRFFPMFPRNEYDPALSERMIDYWTRFARTGDPNGAGAPTWTAFDPARPMEMELGEVVEMRAVEREKQYRLLVGPQAERVAAE